MARSREERWAQFERNVEMLEARSRGRRRRRGARGGRGGRRGRRWLRLSLAALLLLALLAAAAALAVRYAFQEPARAAVGKLIAPEAEWQRGQRPSLTPAIDLAQWIFPPPPGEAFTARAPPPPARVAGPQSALAEAPLCYNAAGRPLPTTARAAIPAGARCTSDRRPTQYVTTAGELRNAVRNAAAGAVIELAPGSYELGRKKLNTAAAGRPERPIVVRAANPGTALLASSSAEPFLIDEPYWVIENLDFAGTCRKDSACEHALHIVGGARATVVRNSTFRDFNAAIKANRLSSPPRSPDDLLIEANLFTNSRARETDNPITPIDVVGADGLRVRGNVVEDFAKAGGDRVSYGIFAKGGARRPLIERNLVRCSAGNAGGTRVGISLGGGGTGGRFCEGGACERETVGGIVRANIVQDCSDVGIYLNRAANSLVANNSLIRTSGIDARFGATGGLIANNIVDGRILERDGAKVQLQDNLTSAWRAALLTPLSDSIFPGAAAGAVEFGSAEHAARRGARLPGGNFADYCGRRVSADNPPVGAIDQREGSACAAAP